MSEPRLGFLASHRFEGDATIRGALLVTDTATKPLEFRVTSPIRPTPFQRTLYGDILNEFVLVELVGMPLLGAVQEKPTILIVRDPLFLGLNKKQPVRTVRVFRETESSSKKDGVVEQLQAPGGKYESVLLDTSPEVQGELVELRKVLHEVFAKRNLLEPFERINVACGQVHKQGLGEPTKSG